jgi:uncharacterized protein
MTIGLYETSVPVFLRYLDRLEGLVDAAEHYALACGTDIAEILEARLALDMLPFATQVHTAAHFALRASFPLAGEPIPPHGEFPPTAEGLHLHIAYVAGLLNTLSQSQFKDRESTVLESKAGRARVSLRAPEFLHLYALPNFFFHVTTAYAILRHCGVAVGKEHFDGFHSYNPL